MSEPPTEKVAVVTGGASGIGLGIARRLARDGAKVAIFDLNGIAATEEALKIGAEGGEAIGVEVDVADREQIQIALNEVHSRFGRVSILINNAGVAGYQPFLKIDTSTWNRFLTVNLTGTFHCCQLVLPDMIASGWGRIVNISSSSTHSGQPLMTHYVASKSGVVGLTKSLALEFGPKGITVNTIPPGFIDTPMIRDAEANGRLGEGVDFHATKTPVRRAGRPEDIAAACAFLVSDEASYITGQVIGVNGGRNT
jgi:NAD(P)-dependent dehydrogenase (short-subunit alcohol dehydrogenase family)